MRGRGPKYAVEPLDERVARQLQNDPSMSSAKPAEAACQQTREPRPTRARWLLLLPAGALVVTTIVAWLAVVSLLVGSVIQAVASLGLPGIFASVAALVAAAVAWQWRRRATKQHDGDHQGPTPPAERPQLARLRSSPQN